MKCKATTKSGKLCKANALKDKKYCLAHDPESKQKFKEITKKGGKVKRKV